MPLSKVTEFSVSEVSERQDGIIEVKGNNGEGIQIGTRDMILKRIRIPPEEPSNHELFRWAMRLLRQIDRDLTNLSVLEGKTIRFTQRLELV